MENHSAKRSLLCRTIIGREVSERGASARVARRLAGRTAISLACMNLYIQVFHDQSFKLEHMFSASKGKLGFTYDL